MIVELLIASLKVAVTVAFAATPVALVAGVVPVIVGALVSATAAEPEIREIAVSLRDLPAT